MFETVVAATQIKIVAKQCLEFEIERAIKGSSYTLWTLFTDDGIIRERKEETFPSIDEAYRRYTQYLGSYKPIEGIKRLKAYEDWQGCVWISNLLGVDIKSI